ncbi:proline and serine-rich protein 2 [Phycodurus eques]|uniref:proline and serine-rich protein 2 n=1 Tax=Phycodurus eques TaxID=693459 RepID=UPI002ACEEF78|nr:proline and serine-rich protein 2 [Phycodurus eques]XP_061524459.1 proline and serine-rich protein 2 [Phycodurus eques]XP_061524460.1 proline and serine-rich protein 2 [Phycodurus eques]
MSQTRLSPSTFILDMADNQRRSRVNGALDRSSRLRDEDTLRFLSPEEKECLQFFEETIGSLENSLEEDELRAGLVKSPASGSLLSDEMDGAPSTLDLCTAPSRTTRRLSAKEQDIIDLVRPDPELMLAKLPSFNPTSPDFQGMAMNPKRQFEIKPRHDPQDHSAGYEPTDGHSYHPAGSVPTPVLIAKKIAENQAMGATNSSSLLQRQHSQEGEKSPGHCGDPPTKQGPPTFAKPTRYPANISRILGNKELQDQPVANVNLHDRRALMLSNLTGAPQSLLQEDSKLTFAHKLRNAPTRSISFKDPTPEKTRMEALSKLGLARNRAMSGGIFVPDTVDSMAPSPVSSVETSVTRPLETKVRPTETSIYVPDSKVPPLLQSQMYVQKAENLSFESPRSFDDRKPPLSPPRQEKTFPTPSQSDIISLELNSFGGKSVVVTPGPPKNEPVTPPTSPEAKVLPSALANPSEFNSYGGKSKVLNPATGVMTRGDLPDILSSHIDVNHNLPAKPQPLPAELNSYGGKSRTINPSTGMHRPTDSRPGAFKGPPPTPAQRHPQTSHPNTGAVAATRAPSPSDAKRRSAAMFRPQGITVQFSGRGATEESRKEALKKLGLLKES